MLDVAPNDSIYSVMCKIQDKEGIPVMEQRLLFQGKQLNDYMKQLKAGGILRNYGIRAGSTIWLSLRLRGGMQRDDHSRSPRWSPPPLRESVLGSAQVSLLRMSTAEMEERAQQSNSAAASSSAIPSSRRAVALTSKESSTPSSTASGSSSHS